MLFGRSVWDEIKTEIKDDSEFIEIKNSIDKMSSIIDTLNDDDLEKVAADESLLKTVLMVYKIGVATHQRDLAMSQYQEIAQNNREADGIFQAVKPDSESIRSSSAMLAGKIRESFSTLDKVRDGEKIAMNQTNEISQPLFTLIGAAAEKFKDQPVIPGTATVRDARGREVAFKKVMVSETELRRMKSTLDAIHTKFKGRTSKADRQDVGSVLDDLKNIVAETSAGQQIGANAKLKDLISDLPLRTAALDTSAADLALMTTEAFTEWLERIESAKFRIEDLLNSQQEWLTLSDRAVNDRFTFLRLSELP